MYQINSFPQTTPPGPLHTLTHGDFWSNNIMFAYDDDGAVKDLIIIDYQLVNYGHPAYDLVYFVVGLGFCHVLIKCSKLQCTA